MPAGPGGWKTLPSLSELGGGKVDLTIGSALDIFGGSGVRYEDAARAGRTYPGARADPPTPIKP